MWGLALADFGRDPRSNDSLRGIVFPKNEKIAPKIFRSSEPILQYVSRYTATVKLSMTLM